MKVQRAVPIVTTAERWFRVDEVMAMTSFGRSFVYAEMERGALRSIKVGGARRIPENALTEWQQRFDGTGEISAK